MRKNLLAIVQEILSDISGDEVNSITDTAGSAQVASIVQSTFMAMVSNRNWPHLKQMIQLTSFSDSSFPTYLRLPESVKELVFIKYNTARVTDNRLIFTDMKWMYPDDFLRYINNRDSSKSNVKMVQDPSGMTLLIRNDIPPTYYTSFDDTTVIFDAYDSLVDSTIQTAKIQAQAYVFPEWVHTDTAIPDLPIEAFVALIEEAKSTASIRLRQIPDNKAEQKSIQQQRWLSRKAWSVNGGIRYPNYGRAGSKVGREKFNNGQ